MTTLVTCIHCRFVGGENLHTFQLCFKIPAAQNQANHGGKVSSKQLTMLVFLVDHPSQKTIFLLAMITE